jgi:hypothetical protein
MQENVNSDPRFVNKFHHGGQRKNQVSEGNYFVYTLFSVICKIELDEVSLE